MVTTKELINDFMTEKQRETYKKLSLNSVKNAHKINKMLETAKTKAQKSKDKENNDKIKGFTLDSYNDFKGFFNVFNHIKKSLKASEEHKHKAKVFTQKFKGLNVLGLLDFNTLLSIKASGFNYGTKSHFTALCIAMIDYINLSTAEQNAVNERGQKVNYLLTAESTNIGGLFDMFEDTKINKKSAKFIYLEDSDLFSMLNLIEVYNHEYEEGRRS